jgi:transposase
MAKVQKVYTREFKEEAVRLVQTSGKSIAQIARELGISDSSIHQWRKDLTQQGKEAFPGSGHQTPLEEENRRLKRELERVQQERDILKKVVSIFSRDSK